MNSLCVRWSYCEFPSFLQVSFRRQIGSALIFCRRDSVQHPTCLDRWRPFTNVFETLDASQTGKKTRGVGGGGSINNFLYGEALPRGPTVLFYIQFLDRKGTPFVFLLLTNGTPFIYLVTKSDNQSVFSTFSVHWNASVSSFRPFYRRASLASTSKIPTISYTWRLKKGIPFRRSRPPPPPRIGHHRECPCPRVRISFNRH